MSKEASITRYSATSSIRKPFALVRSCIHDIVRSRDLIWILFLRELQASFRQSLLGYAWLFLPPIAMAGIWFLLRAQKIVRVETEVPYVLFVVIGVTIWISFLSFLKAPMTGFTNGKSVFSKLNVPIEAFILSAVLRAFLEFLIRSVVIVPIFFLTGASSSWLAVFYPLASILLFMIALAIGMVTLSIGGLYGDVSRALTNIARPVMYLSPVVYPVSSRKGWLSDIMHANPLTPGIAFCRDLLTTGSLEWMWQTIIFGGVALLITLLSFVMLRVAKPHLVERLGM